MHDTAVCCLSCDRKDIKVNETLKLGNKRHDPILTPKNYTKKCGGLGIEKNIIYQINVVPFMNLHSVTVKTSGIINA